MRTESVVKSPAVESIREDHRRILNLFALCHSESDPQRQKEIADRAIAEFEVHSFVEERVLYPFCSRKLDLGDIVAEAREAHAGAKRLIFVLKEMPAGKQYRSVLARLRQEITEHIEEEEKKLLMPLESSDMDLRALSAELNLARAAGRVKSNGRSLGMILLGVVGAAAAYYYFRGRKSE